MWPTGVSISRLALAMAELLLWPECCALAVTSILPSTLISVLALILACAFARTLSVPDERALALTSTSPLRFARPRTAWTSRLALALRAVAMRVQQLGIGRNLDVATDGDILVGKQICYGAGEGDRTVTTAGCRRAQNDVVVHARVAAHRSDLKVGKAGRIFRAVARIVGETENLDIAVDMNVFAGVQAGVCIGPGMGVEAPIEG